MKATELMIGYWVKFKNSDLAHKVIAVAGKSIKVDKTHWYSANIFDPIPLTPEILERNGFTKELDADGLHYRYILIDGHIKFSILYARSVFQWLGPLDFKYVHELQHALRLCGIKKEIIL